MTVTVAMVLTSFTVPATVPATVCFIASIVDLISAIAEVVVIPRTFSATLVLGSICE